MQLVPTTIRSSSPVRGALDTALCNKVCQRFAEGLVFSGQGTLDLEMKLIFLLLMACDIKYCLQISFSSLVLDGLKFCSRSCRSD
jgi:hypothetical protein